MNRARVVEEARAWIGTPYRHQAATKGAGCDCLGLLRGVWRELYGFVPVVPPYTSDWDEVAREDVLQRAARLSSERKVTGGAGGGRRFAVSDAQRGGCQAFGDRLAPGSFHSCLQRARRCREHAVGAVASAGRGRLCFSGLLKH